jgi:hypothetical protein
MTACSMPRASISTTASTATTDCWPFRTVSSRRKRVVPYPRTKGTITRYPFAASNGATST